MGDSRPPLQHSACYITSHGEDEIVEAVRRCGFDLVMSDPSSDACVAAAPAILLIDAGCARSEDAAQRLLDTVPLHGGQVLLLGSAEDQAPWEKWLRSGEGMFLRQPVSPQYLEELLRDIKGELPCNARLISATNRDPETAVANGHLREDLFYRICQFGITVPPLRERGDDVLALARRFIAEFSDRNGKNVRLGADARHVIESHDWPGNVRELRHAMHRACRLSRNVITPEHLPDLNSTKPCGNPDGDGLGIEPGVTLAEAERRLILATLDAQDGDRKRAAQTLGISVRTLYNRLREYRAAGDLD